MACDLGNYDQNGFVTTLNADNPDQVANAKHIEIAITGPDGANRLHIFTGVAIVGFGPTDDRQRRGGVVRLILNVPPLPLSVQIMDSACNAELASISSFDEDVTTVFAVDCVSTDAETVTSPLTHRHRQLLILTAALSITGAAGHTGINRISYQANVRVKLKEVELNSLLVSDLKPLLTFGPDPPGPPLYAPSVRLLVGDVWGGRVLLDGPAPSPGITVFLSSSNQQLVPVPLSVVVAAGADSRDCPPPPMLPVGFVGTTTDVIITATYKGVSKMATVTIGQGPK